MREGCTRVSLTSSPGIVSNQRTDMRHESIQLEVNVPGGLVTFPVMVGRIPSDGGVTFPVMVGHIPSDGDTICIIELS